jgi:hypothetical protein
VTPTATDIRIAELVHAAVAHVPAAGRFGDRKVFISAIWSEITKRHFHGVLGTEAGFRAWLLRALPMTDETGAPLMLLARADLVSAMDPELVEASEITDRGSCFHFVIDRATDPRAYEPPRQAADAWKLPADAKRGTVGGGR